ncbi:MAG TPA: acyl-CoA thioester hydrolase/BAAT C-terminal domain-containing protein [Jiangellales bacterium]|nr:acyl-CoA thioester hydrolase/BAAT C-terminal domain-containing protein [Jiangellales bacterium]
MSGLRGQISGREMARLMVLVLLLVAATPGCAVRRAAVHGTMTVTPSLALYDAPVTGSVRGLPSGAHTTITATATDAAGVAWSASAKFRANRDGVVSFDQAPLGGSYAQADPMGLLEFMAPRGDAAEHPAFEQPLSGDYEVEFEASVNGSTVATTRIRRQSPGAAGVVPRDLRVPTEGIYGTLFRPKDTSAKRPGVLVFGGSEGGLHPAVKSKAALLAAHGFPALALAYFDAPGLPDTLTAIPLEYFTKALSVLRARAGVDPQRVFLRGTSRGGEASLLLASYFPHLVNGVIAEVPSPYVVPSPARLDRSAWSLRGRDLPHATERQLGAPAVAVDPRTHIPVERIRGPVLLTCGQIDPVWPSCPNVEDISARLTAHRFGYPVTVLRYPEAGHLVGTIQPYTSFTNALLVRAGGSVAGTQAANVDVHIKALALLAQSD